jgi:hypothetical protein
MKDKVSLRHRDGHRTRIERLIPFKEGSELAWEVEERSGRNPMPPSKYRKILTCSLTDGTGDAARLERMTARRG